MELKNWQVFYQKARLFIWPIVVGMAALVIIILVIIPQLINFWNEREQINQLKNRVFILDAKADELSSIPADQLQKNLINSYAFLPADREIPEAVTILQNLISQAQLSLKSMTYLALGKDSQPPSFRLSIVVAGRLDNIRTFLISLQNAPRLYQIDAINAQFDAANSEIETEISLAVYYDNTAVKIGNPEQVLPKFSDQDNQLMGELTKLSSSNQTQIVRTSTAAAILGKDNPFE